MNRNIEKDIGAIAGHFIKHRRCGTQQDCEKAPDLLALQINSAPFRF